jgi:tRNA(Ile)-lysidine synthase
VPAAEAKPVTDGQAAALFADLSSSSALVLAVSGGPDSTALLMLAARWQARLKRGPKLLAVTVDHGLRPESAAEARAVKRLAASLGVAHRTMRWKGPKPTSGVQQVARAARYMLLADAARRLRARHILTAHTRDDQAETVLFRLARGSGLAGLKGMTRISPLPIEGAGDVVLVRPLLEVPKVRLVATLTAAGIPFADDPSNRDPRFTRPRLRALLPSLAAEGLDAARLATLARRLGRADQAIEQAVDAAQAALAPGPWERTGPIVLNVAAFGALPAETAFRLLGRAVTAVGDEGPVELSKLEGLFDVLEAGLAGTARIRRTLAGALVTLARGLIVIERAPPRRTGAKRGAREHKRTFTKPR